MVRVFVCDDSEWFSDLVAAYIEPHADLQFVGSADERDADGFIGKGGGEAALVAAIRALVG